MLVGYFTFNLIMVFVYCYFLALKFVFHIQFNIFSKFTASVDVDEQLV